MPVAGAVLRVQQPARRALRDRMVGVARHRLHHLREQIIGEAAEDVGDEGRPALRFLQRLHRDAIGRAADQHRRAREGGSMAAADDSADRALAADRRHLDRPAARELDRQRDHRRADGKQARIHLVAAREDDVAGRELDDLAEGLDQRPRFRGEGRKQPISGEGLVGLLSVSSVVVSATSFIPRPALIVDTRPVSCAIMRRRKVAPSAVDWLRPVLRCRRAGNRRPAGSGATSTRLRRSSIRSTNWR